MDKTYHLMEALDRVHTSIRYAYVYDEGRIAFYDTIKPNTMALLILAIREEAGFPWFKPKEDVEE